MAVQSPVNLQLSRASEADAAFQLELYTDVHAAEFAALGLAPTPLRQLLEMQFRAQRQGYRTQFPEAIDEIIVVNGRPAGRLLVSETAGEIRLVDLALLAARRGQGVGTAVLGSLSDRARRAGLPLRLSVRRGNPAERLYQRMGFVRTGETGMESDMELDAASPAPQPSPPRVPGPAEPLSFAWFAALLEQPVTARVDATAVELIVISVTPLAGAAAGRADSFSVIFAGPSEPVLPSACAELLLAPDDTISLFLVPLGPYQRGMQYEAVFNPGGLPSRDQGGDQPAGALRSESK